MLFNKYLLLNTQCVRQMVKAPNAYTYSNDTGGGVSGNVMTLTLNGAGGSAMSVSHTDEPFELWMDGTPPHTLLGHFSSTKCGGSVAEWLACWTQAQKGPGSNRSRDAVG